MPIGEGATDQRGSRPLGSQSWRRLPSFAKSGTGAAKSFGERMAGVDIKSLIRTIPDYPKPGILFRDITTLIADPVGLRAAVDGLVLPFVATRIDFVAGIEARGFILGGAVAHELGRGFIPIRKKGKLPWRTIGQEYSLEYGVDTIEIHADAIHDGAKVLLIDDLIATGGTAEAAIELIRRSGGDIVAAAFVIDLSDLGGSRRIAAKQVSVHTLVSFEGH
jgi:adenine phosphoribosyltransferase